MDPLLTDQHLRSMLFEVLNPERITTIPNPSAKAELRPSLSFPASSLHSSPSSHSFPSSPSSSSSSPSPSSLSSSPSSLPSSPSLPSAPSASPSPSAFPSPSLRDSERKVRMPSPISTHSDFTFPTFPTSSTTSEDRNDDFPAPPRSQVLTSPQDPPKAESSFPSTNDSSIPSLYRYWSGSSSTERERERERGFNGNNSNSNSNNNGQPYRRLNFSGWETTEELALENEYRKCQKKHGLSMCPDELLQTHNYAQMRMVIKLMNDETEYNRYYEKWHRTVTSMITGIKLLLHTQGIKDVDTKKMLDEMEAVLQQEHENMRIDYYEEIKKKTAPAHPRREVWQHLVWALAASTAKVIVDHAQANGTSILASLPMLGPLKVLLSSLLPRGLREVFQAVTNNTNNNNNNNNNNKKNNNSNNNNNNNNNNNQRYDSMNPASDITSGFNMYPQQYQQHQQHQQYQQYQPYQPYQQQQQAYPSFPEAPAPNSYCLAPSAISSTFTQGADASTNQAVAVAVYK